MNSDDLREQLERLAGPPPVTTAQARDAVQRRVRRSRRRMGAVSATATVLVVAIVVAGVYAAQSSPVAVRTVTSTTATTRAPNAGCASVPEPVPPQEVPSDVAKWAGGLPVVGGGELWAARLLLAIPPTHDHGIWRSKISWLTRPFGIPRIDGRRLDGSGTFHADANRAVDQRGVWVVSSLEFSAAGCWEVTARYDLATITYRILVGNPPQPVGSGTITGTLEEVGGPAPGAPHAVAGTIQIKGISESWAGTTDAAGHFSADLLAGAYSVTGSSPSYLGDTGGCGAGPPVVVAAGHTTTITVVCPVR